MAPPTNAPTETHTCVRLDEPTILPTLDHLSNPAVSCLRLARGQIREHTARRPGGSGSPPNDSSRPSQVLAFSEPWGLVGSNCLEAGPIDCDSVTGVRAPRARPPNEHSAGAITFEPSNPAGRQEGSRWAPLHHWHRAVHPAQVNRSSGIQWPCPVRLDHPLR